MNKQDKTFAIFTAVVIVALLSGIYYFAIRPDNKDLIPTEVQDSGKTDDNNSTLEEDSSTSIDLTDTLNIKNKASSNSGNSGLTVNKITMLRSDVISTVFTEINLTNDYIERQKEKDKEKKTKRIKWGLSKPNRDLKFNKVYNQEFIDINSNLYSIVQRYFSSETFRDTPYSSYADPLYIMAISNVEFGGDTNPSILLAPAIPTNKNIDITKDNILTFGYSDYLNYGSVLAGDRDGYRGPLQLYVTGFTEAIKPEDLLSCEYIQLKYAKDSDVKSAEVSNLQYVEGSGTTTTLDGMTLLNKAGNYGDRFNYGDSVNRIAGFIHNNWLLYNKNNKAQKNGELEINNIYSWMSMSAIGHNSSPGIYYMSDSMDIGGSFYWWPYGPYSNARKYSHYLGTDNCINYIANLAQLNLSKSRLESSLKFRLSRQEGVELAKELVTKGYIPDGLWKCENANHEEKIAYPIQVLYNYFILEGIYSGK